MSTNSSKKIDAFINGITAPIKTIANLFSSSSSSYSLSLKPATPSILRTAGNCLCCHLSWPITHRRKPNTKVTIIPKHPPTKTTTTTTTTTTNDQNQETETTITIRIATFNAALFSMAPAVPTAGRVMPDRPMKGILKQEKFSSSKRRVFINLQEDEISSSKGKSPEMMRGSSFRTVTCERSVLDVLKEIGADVIGLQNVKAEDQERGTRPLSDLAQGLGMEYVFADSWAPEYGNAILSRWPIKHWRVQKIFDDSDFRNVLKATIDVPNAGEVNFQCTHLDHLDENWRMKQISAILQSNSGPHILAGGLNSLDETDYSQERWNNIVNYYEGIGKPTPKVEVMKFLKGKRYSDAKDFAGECESVVVVAKGQDVQGTCKYGTRVDYILASPNSQYKFVAGSYGIVSSKGTSDHHIVKVDIVIDKSTEDLNKRRKQLKQRIVKIDKDSSAGIWGTNS